LDNNEKERFMGSFPQVDPRYGKILAARQVPTVLSRHELDALFAELKEPCKLLAMIMRRKIGTGTE